MLDKQIQGWEQVICAQIMCFPAFSELRVCSDKKLPYTQKWSIVPKWKTHSWLNNAIISFTNTYLIPLAFAKIVALSHVTSNTTNCDVLESFRPSNLTEH